MFPSHDPRRGKRAQNVNEVLADLDLCSVRSLVRIALKAENAKQYSVAGSIWKDLHSYMQPRFKAIDPLEQAAKAKEVMSMEDLQKMKQAVLSGDIHQVQEAVPEVIDGSAELLWWPVPITKVIETAPHKYI